MKKILIFVLALTLIFCFGACANKGNENAEENVIGMPNPMKTCESLEEINAAAGTNLMKPGVMGVSDEKFFTITGSEYTIAEYRFNLNGIEYTIRGAAATEDISGYYIDGKTAFAEAGEGLEYAEDNGVKLARFFDLNGQTVITAKGDIEDDIFAGIVEEFQIMSAQNGGRNGEDEPVITGVPNPMTEVASLGELNEATGCNFMKPGVMGISDEQFFTIQNGEELLGEYRFTVNGVEYTHRAGAVTEDISGVWVGEATAFADAETDLTFVDAYGIKLARWFDLNGQHVIYGKGDIEDEVFIGVVEELQTLSAQNGGANG